MGSSVLVAIVATSAGLLATAGAFGQNKPAPGPFDGKWVGESARCSPTSNNYRFNGMTVVNSSMNWQATDGGRKMTCRVIVNRDGSFTSAQDCFVQVTGKFEGNTATLRIKTSERDCSVVAKRA